jgi:PAS domain S-box-containing protein
MSVSLTENLAAAFETFNETTQRLKTAYDKLQEKLAQLDRELEEKNRQLLLKVDELNRTKNYLNDILEAMTDGVVAVDIDGRITTFNTAAQRITGFTASEVKGRSYGEVLGDGFGEMPRLGTLLSPQPGHVATELRSKDSTAVPVSESVAVLTDREGNVVGAVKVFQDLSEVTKLREQVRQKDRLAAVGQMAATVAHEIRNPLGGIEGFAALLARDIDEEDPRRRLVEKILTGTRSLNRVVSELLAFTRPMELKFEEIDAEDLLRSVVVLAGDERDGIDVHLSSERRGKRNKLHGDPEMLGQVFLNLALNAFQSMPQGGELEIGISAEPRTEGEPPSVRVRFSDTGCGIPNEVLPRIFEPFFTTKEKGTGLGLALAARVIEGHGGRIAVSSEAGVGSTFEVWLPCSAHSDPNVNGDGNGG